MPKQQTIMDVDPALLAFSQNLMKLDNMLCGALSRINPAVQMHRDDLARMEGKTSAPRMENDFGGLTGEDMLRGIAGEYMKGYGTKLPRYKNIIWDATRDYAEIPSEGFKTLYIDVIESAGRGYINIVDRTGLSALKSRNIAVKVQRITVPWQVTINQNSVTNIFEKVTGVAIQTAANLAYQVINSGINAAGVPDAEGNVVIPTVEVSSLQELDQDFAINELSDALGDWGEPTDSIFSHTAYKRIRPRNKFDFEVSALGLGEVQSVSASCIEDAEMGFNTIATYDADGNRVAYPLNLDSNGAVTFNAVGSKSGLGLLTRREFGALVARNAWIFSTPTREVMDLGMPFDLPMQMTLGFDDNFEKLKGSIELVVGFVVSEIPNVAAILALAPPASGEAGTVSADGDTQPVAPLVEDPNDPADPDE